MSMASSGRGVAGCVWGPVLLLVWIWGIGCTELRSNESKDGMVAESGADASGQAIQHQVVHDASVGMSMAGRAAGFDSGADGSPLDLDAGPSPRTGGGPSPRTTVEPQTRAADTQSSDGGAELQADSSVLDQAAALEQLAGTVAAADCSSYELAGEGRCGGFYCGVSLEVLAAASDPGATCYPLDGFDGVASLCDNRLLTLVGRCGRRELANDPIASESALRIAVRRCMYEDPDVRQRFSEPCVDCYVQESLCSGQNCPVECLLGDSAECEVCRARAGCEAALFACSGLPNPL